ncbi:glycosyltransferase [Sinomonas sp. ASV322]|uniref:glycosyltransferase n=1 Tax=Sinomonas sp. ASV322 TaxID=3041920 RepID=UPI0027DADE11|nr:glycosyltransferase [Sinomonas sp. ASV322]MDQ4500773.1 glycosyltransferase [Sinomonas sp. ASV322]
MTPPRVALASAPAYGHLYPLMPLAYALQRAGADVHVAVGTPFHGRLDFPTRVGFPEEATLDAITAEVMSTFPEVRDNFRERWVPSFFGNVIARQALPTLREQWATESPDLVIYETMFPAAKLVADELGARAITFGITQWSPFLGSLPAVALAADQGDERKPWEVAGTSMGFDGAGYIDPFPASFQTLAESTPESRIPVRTTAWSEPAPETDPSLMAPPADGRPRVFVTLGTVSFGAVDALRTAVLGAASTGAEVIVACGPAGDPAALGDVPDNVRLHRFVPQAALLPTLDAIVHHGGSGTMLAAVEHGVPQLIVPQGADQFFNAEAVERAGVGLSGAAGLDVDGVAESVARLLDDGEHRAAARRLAGEVAATPSPDDVARRLLEQL